VNPSDRHRIADGVENPGPPFPAGLVVAATEGAEEGKDWQAEALRELADEARDVGCEWLRRAQEASAEVNRLEAELKAARATLHRAKCWVSAWANIEQMATDGPDEEIAF
jgi:hypothetical protein